MKQTILKRSLLVALALTPMMAGAQDAAEAALSPMEEFQASPGYAKFMVDNLWILISAALVFLMHLGFATLETGLTRQKNCVNVLFKNLFIVSIGILTYALCGFNTMYPSAWMMENFLAFGGPIGFDEADAVANLTAQYSLGTYTYWSDFIFQAMFAATAATIVSGAVAERVKLPSFMLFATLLVGVAYPITGSWDWGTGWLDQKGFTDFAGSTLVHAMGGFAALACVIVLGPRKGKFQADGSIRPILGHNMPLATIGVFLLWLGWYGFNGGSVFSADPAGVSIVFVTTTLAAAAGVIGAMATSWTVLKKPDLSMALNGALAGLVGITAGADLISPGYSVLVGFIAGIIVVFSVLFFDKIKIDDPVGAISVHGICGIFGTLCVGFVGDISFKWQLIGTLSIAAFSFIFSFVVFSAIKAVLGVRVSEEEEFGGLDVGEHGNEAYPDFQKTSA